MEFRGGRFSKVANVLHKRDFQSVTATLSAVGSVSASRSVRSGRFYCIMLHKDREIICTVVVLYICTRRLLNILIVTCVGGFKGTAHTVTSCNVGSILYEQY